MMLAFRTAIGFSLSYNQYQQCELAVPCPGRCIVTLKALLPEFVLALNVAAMLFMHPVQSLVWRKVFRMILNRCLAFNNLLTTKAIWRVRVNICAGEQR